MPVGAGFIPARIGENKKMTEHKKLQPEIRFAGFTDDWEQRKLGDVSFSYSGGTPSVNNLSFYGGSIPFIRSGEINDETTELFITEEGLNNSSAKLVEKGNILYALYGATSGEVGRSKIHGAINQAILAIVPYVNYDSEFIAQWLRRNKYSIISTYLQGGQGNLSGEIVKNLILELPPSKEEQTKIGNFFKQLDDTIALHQRTLEKYQKLKISYLEKMFPKENELYPELRFPNFTDAWEQRKLGDICNITTGKLDANAMVENGKYDFFTSGIKKYKIDHYAFLGPALTIAGNGATVGYMHYADGFFNAYQRTYVLTELLGDRTFLFSTINRKLQKKIQQEARAGNIPYIVLDMLTELDIYLPSLEEQTQIGNFFKQLDDTISLHQREVEKYKKIKQSYLEKMFI